MWTYAGTVLRLCAQIGFTAVLARVLGPTPFGIAGMGVAVLGAASFIADQGLGSALVQRERLDERLIRIAFTRLMLTGLCLAALGVIGAPWIAEYFKEPRLVMPMQVLSLVFIPSALAVVSGAVLRRSLRFKALQTTQLASYLGPYGLLGIPMALSGFGVWALVAAMLGQAVLGALLMFAVARHPVRPLWGGGTAGLSRYGWRTAFSNFLSWLAENLPQFFVGRAFGAAPLGLYNAAYNSVRTPVNFLAGGGIEVLYAAGARSEAATEFRRRTLTVSAALIGTVFLPTFAAAAALSETLVLTLYGADWRMAAELVVPFALAMPALAFSGTGSALLGASGLVQRDLAIQGLSVVLLLTILLAASRFSLQSVAWSAFAVLLVRAAFVSRAVLKSVQLRWIDLLRAWRLGALTALWLTPVLALLDAGLVRSGWPRPVVLLVDVAAGAALLAVGTVLARRLLPSAARWTIAQILRRLPFGVFDRWARLFD
jgi:PST family polysaccharide transporter